VKKHIIITISLVLVFSVALLFSQEITLPKGKQTKLGLYVTAKEAYAKWLKEPEKVKILDSRTPEEYLFVGHAPMAYNIPVKFITPKIDKAKTRPVMEDNPDFVAKVETTFQKDDVILIMCRSGGRSALAVNMLAEAGFTKVYTITDGFEGDLVKDEMSAYHGKRLRNGWKNAGNPWTYDLDPKLIYSEDESEQ
jgi:rhodanese-related sulfurtransferase